MQALPVPINHPGSRCLPSRGRRSKLFAVPPLLLGDDDADTGENFTSRRWHMEHETLLPSALHSHWQNIYRTLCRKIISGYVAFHQTSHTSRRNGIWIESIFLFIYETLGRTCENISDKVARFLAVVRQLSKRYEQSERKNTDTLYNENVRKLVAKDVRMYAADRTLINRRVTTQVFHSFRQKEKELVAIDR